MKRHLTQAFVIMRMAWQKNLNYRFTVFMYRIGETAEILVLILMWSAIYAGEETIRGFTLNEMITYVLIGNLCQVAVRNFLAGHVSRDIQDGRLSMYLVKPISYIRYTLTHEIGRIFLATVVSFLSQVVVILFFLNKVALNTDPAYLAVIVAMIFLAFVIELLIGFLVGTIAFWTDEVDGLQATIDRIKRFFSGGYFPLSLLPTIFGTVSFFLPFGYSFFVPASLYLKKMSLSEGLAGLAVQVCWIAAFAVIIHFVWKRGLRKYEAVGS